MPGPILVLPGRDGFSQVVLVVSKKPPPPKPGETGRIYPDLRRSTWGLLGTCRTLPQKIKIRQPHRTLGPCQSLMAALGRQGFVPYHSYEAQSSPNPTLHRHFAPHRSHEAQCLPNATPKPSVRHGGGFGRMAIRSENIEQWDIILCLYIEIYNIT